MDYENELPLRNSRYGLVQSNVKNPFTGSLVSYVYDSSSDEEINPANII